MPNPPNLLPILSFLDQLRQNNHKAWFDAHRTDYQDARAIFEQLIDLLIDEFRSEDDLQGLMAKDCTARIYRDIRFSKDKTPYKTNFGALVAPGGWKGGRLGYYIHLEPRDLSMVAGGVYAPSAEQLYRFRQAVDRRPARLEAVTGAEDFVRVFGQVSGDRLKTAPRGYDPAHPQIETLKLKQITAIHRFTDAEALGADYLGRVIGDCRAMRAFLDYLADNVA